MTRVRIQILIAVLTLLPVLAGAQDRLTGKAALDYHTSHNLWFDSGNAAGLSLSPLNVFNTVGFGYRFESGDYHRKQSGQGLSDFDFDTQGARSVGKIQLWGHFRYENTTETGTSYNTILNDPYDERQLFSVADPNISDWKRQCYEMEFKASRRLTQALAGGIHLRYADRISAKQVDPRSESYKYNIDIRPALAWQKGKSIFGFSGIYAHQFERSVPVLSNVSEIQDVFVVRGLGNFVKDMVGSGGLSTIYYHTDTFGGMLQFSRGGMLAEAGYFYHGTSTRESATQPFNMGSTAMNEITGRFRMILPSSLVSAGASFRATDATEITSVWSLETGEWEERTSALGSTYSTANAFLQYDRYAGKLDGAPYRWKFSGKAEWTDKQDRYLLPEAAFTYDNLSMTLAAERLFMTGQTQWCAGLSAAGNLNLSGSYTYSGIQKEGLPVKDWYPFDSAILTSDYMLGRLNIGLSRPLHGRMEHTALTLEGSTGYLLASESRSRIYFHVEAGLLF